MKLIFGLLKKKKDVLQHNIQTTTPLVTRGKIAATTDNLPLRKKNYRNSIQQFSRGETTKR